MNQITSPTSVRAPRFGKACLMTSATTTDAAATAALGTPVLETPVLETPVLDGSAAASAAHDQSDAADADRAARKAKRAMAWAWGALVFGLVISLGTFGLIATHDYHADHAATASSTAP